MNRSIGFFYLPFLLLSSTGWCVQAKAPPATLTLPEGVRTTLDTEYPGWKLAPVTPAIQKTYRDHKVGHSPNIAAGDFNQDGHRDYAVQIVLQTPGQEEQIIIVFLARGEGFEESIVQSMGIDSSYSLWVTRAKLDESGAHPEKAEMKDVLMVLGGPVGDTVYSFDTDKFHEVSLPEEMEHPDASIPRSAPPPDAPPEQMEP